MTDYHWTPANQRKFLEALSETGSVETACKDVEMSRRAAYNLRNRRDGHAFRIGWDAATALARTAVADSLMDMALHGQLTETVYDRYEQTSLRRHYNAHLSMALLTRLDRQADAVCASPHADIVRAVSQDFETFLDLVAGDKAVQALLHFGGDAYVAAHPQVKLAIQCELARVSADFEGEVDVDLECEAQPMIQAEICPASHPGIQCELAPVSADFEDEAACDIDAVDADTGTVNETPVSSCTSDALIAQLEQARADRTRHYFEQITPGQALAQLEACG